MRGVVLPSEVEVTPLLQERLGLRRSEHVIPVAVFTCNLAFVQDHVTISAGLATRSS